MAELLFTADLVVVGLIALGLVYTLGMLLVRGLRGDRQRGH